MNCDSDSLDCGTIGLLTDLCLSFSKWTIIGTVPLIGYCVDDSLFLVYEYIENGNLSQHLCGSGRELLPWSTRVQIALDSGCENAYENGKSSIFIVSFLTRLVIPQVADFGPTKLTEVGSASLHTSHGYFWLHASGIHVYAFGVVLYELISGKEAIIKTNEVVTESKGLIALFEEVLSQTDPGEGLCKLVDPRLGDSYPPDSVRKMVQLARACTHGNPQLRSSMRSIVVALMTLSSSTEDWDIGSFCGNQGMVNLMSGR
ncbi:unnamed protein product [Ilex paraguariensis]|uniref:Uncharacterized protein n=1 Tax=Ilex paraguariensis TaxID=185542 RepID=A0ABC8UW70_9AQUA